MVCVAALSVNSLGTQWMDTAGYSGLPLKGMCPVSPRLTSAMEYSQLLWVTSQRDFRAYLRICFYKSRVALPLCLHAAFFLERRLLLHSVDE